MHVCRAIAQGIMKERTKTKKNRHVLLNGRSLHPGVRRSIRGAAESWEWLNQSVSVRFPALKDESVHPSDLRPSQTVGTNPEEAGDTLSAAVQLPSHLCDNMHNVWHESRLYCSTAWTQRPNAAVDLCALAELQRRLGRDGKTPECPRNGPSIKCAARNPLIGKVIDLHS